MIIYNYSIYIYILIKLMQTASLSPLTLNTNCLTGPERFKKDNTDIEHQMGYSDKKVSAVDIRVIKACLNSLRW